MINMDSDLADLVFKLTALCFTAGVLYAGVILFFKRFGAESNQLKNRINEIQKVSKHLDTEKIMDFDKPGDFNFFQQLSRKIGFFDQLKFLIIRSGVEVSESNFFWLCMILMLTSFIFGYFVGMDVILTLILGVFVGALPILYLKHKAKVIQEKILTQLPEALDFLIRTLQVGHGLTAIFGMMGEELPSPINMEFKILGQEISFGLPFAEAMLNFTKRTNSTDINFLVVGLLVQRESGGNLIGLLQGLANDIRERFVFYKKVQILATESVYSAVLLFALPFVIAGVLILLNPQYMSVLWTTEAGQKTIKITLFAMCIGGLWMRKISKIKV
jgi:tight adherence protein B